jgi:regulator of sigma E protease
LRIDRGGRDVDVVVPAGAFTLDVTGQIDSRALGLRWERVSSRVGVDQPDSPAGLAGVRTGDAIVSVDGTDVRSWADLQVALTPGREHTLGVKRGERTEDGVSVTDHELLLTPAPWTPPHDVLSNPWGLVPVEVFIGEVMDDGAAQDAGLNANDRLLWIDGQAVWSWTDVEDLVRATVADMGPDAQPRAMRVDVVRGGEVLTLSFTPRIRRDLLGADVIFKPLMGIYRYQDAYIEGGETHIYYSPLKAMQRAWQEGSAIFSSTMKMLGNVLTGATSLKESVGGPVAIFHIASKSVEYGIFSFVRLMAQISFSLGIVNLLPVPVLDGGQILFYSIEGVRGRPLPLELREKVQMVGVLAMAALLLTVTVVDLSRLFDG